MITYTIVCYALVFLLSCKEEKPAQQPAITEKDLWVDTSVIPKDTVMQADVFTASNGIIKHGIIHFSGYVKTVYPKGNVQTLTPVYNGVMQGVYRSYYPDGTLNEVRQYKDNMSTGKHYGFWANGNKKFEYLYYRDQKIGYMNKWYETGKPYLFLNYKNDHEDGLQRGWRENGKLFINYVARDGYKYGLQETMLCYKLDKGEVIK